MGDHDPQQIVELDDAGDLAAEGVELGGACAPRAAPPRSATRVRAARALAAIGHEHEQDQRHDIGGIGDGEFVERRQEEEIEGEHAQPLETHSEGTRPWRAAATSTGTTKTSETLGTHDAGIDQPCRARSRPPSSARPRGRARASAARFDSQSVGPDGAGASPDGATSMASPEPLRTSSSTTEPWRSSNQRERLRLADHDARGVARPGEGQDLLDHRAARHRHHLGAELGGQPHASRRGGACSASSSSVAWRSVST